jgi:lipoyl synthase
MKKPAWLRKPLPMGPEYERVRSMMKGECLHTVCQEAKCPNQWECFSRQTATFLIMGDRCTRNCRFCAVLHGPVGAVDPEEPSRVADAARTLGLNYVVVTSVTRDDLPDGGAEIFARTIREIHRKKPGSEVEVLIPDFQGDHQALAKVLHAHPAVLNHNIETVARLYPAVRPGAAYERSLELLAKAHAHVPAVPVKSGMMLGLGETEAEVKKTLVDLFEAGCRLLTLGQYLQPSAHHLPVERFVPPEEFDAWKAFARDLGFRGVASGPFVRSSYQAGEMYGAVAGSAATV